MPEAKQDPAEVNDKYYLKEGREHTIIVAGEPYFLKGDNGDYAELTEAQYQAFADKFHPKGVKSEVKQVEPQPQPDPVAPPPADE